MGELVGLATNLAVIVGLVVAMIKMLQLVREELTFIKKRVQKPKSLGNVITPSHEDVQKYSVQVRQSVTPEDGNPPTASISPGLAAPDTSQATNSGPVQMPPTQPPRYGVSIHGDFATSSRPDYAPKVASQSRLSRLLKMAFWALVLAIGLSLLV